MALVIRERCIGCGACAAVCPTSAISGEKGELYRIDPYICIECGACGRVCPAAAVEDVEGNIIEKVPRSQWLVPHISLPSCVSCEKCVEVCPSGALIMVSDEYHGRLIPALAYPKSCVSCRWCYENCQFDAILMHELVL
ncbi:MAG: 4Fe-4S binding protein [Spirochaetota bacterium]